MVAAEVLSAAPAAADTMALSSRSREQRHRYRHHPYQRQRKAHSMLANHDLIRHQSMISNEPSLADVVATLPVRAAETSATTEAGQPQSTAKTEVNEEKKLFNDSLQDPSPSCTWDLLGRLSTSGGRRRRRRRRHRLMKLMHNGYSFAANYENDIRLLRRRRARILDTTSPNAFLLKRGSIVLPSKAVTIRDLENKNMESQVDVEEAIQGVDSNSDDDDEDDEEVEEEENEVEDEDEEDDEEDDEEEEDEDEDEDDEDEEMEVEEKVEKKVVTSFQETLEEMLPILLNVDPAEAVNISAAKHLSVARYQMLEECGTERTSKACRAYRVVESHVQWQANASRSLNNDSSSFNVPLTLTQSPSCRPGPCDIHGILPPTDDAARHCKQTTQLTISMASLESVRYRRVREAHSRWLKTAHENLMMLHNLITGPLHQRVTMLPRADAPAAGKCPSPLRFSL